MNERTIPTTLRVGDPVWVFDLNRRKYVTDANGKSVGGPIWREHWAKWFVVDETRVSWLISPYRDTIARASRKVPKKASERDLVGLAFSEHDIDEMAFVEDNRRVVARAVECVRDADTLRAVMATLGMDAKGAS